MTTPALASSKPAHTSSLHLDGSVAEKLKVVAIKAFGALLAGQPVTLTTGTLLAKVYYDGEEISVKCFTDLLEENKIVFLTEQQTENSNYYLQRPPITY